MDEETQTLNDTVAAAFDAAEATDQGEPVPPAPSSEPVEAAPEATEATGERIRDGHGRFARKSPAEPALTPSEAPAATGKAPAAVAAPPTATAAAPVSELRAPQSWKLTEREAWAQVPRAAQEAVLRREREAQLALQESAEGRKNWSRFQERVRQYEPMFAATGHDIVDNVGNLLQTVAVLQSGTPAQRAAIAANIIQSYGIDVDQLAKAMDQPAHQPQAPSFQPQDVRQLVAQEFQSMRQQALHQRAVSDLQQFETNPPEFWHDLRSQVADILEVHGRRGVELTLQAAYDLACKMDPEVQKVLEQRNAAKRAVVANANTQRVKAAASSLRSTPAAGGSAQPKSLRDTVAAAYDDASR